MGLLQMSLHGAVMISVVALIRTVAVNRLPKRTFIMLWSVVLIRLLIPFEVPSDFSVYSLVGRDVTDFMESARQSEETVTDSNVILGENFGEKNAASEVESLGSPLYEEEEALLTDMSVEMSAGEVWLIIYVAGVIVCAVYFIASYVRCSVEFSMSLPVSNDYVEQWLKERRISGGGNRILSRIGRLRHRSLMTVSIRVSDRIDTPLTYRVIHPVILLPKKTAWEDTEQLRYVLWHEYTHICYGDSILKLFAAAALCVHWFNPCVWAMYFMMNRDIELACDESVVHRCGMDDKTAYANMLIAMEAKRSGLVPFGNHFSRNAIEGRVRAIMKIKKISFGAVIFAVGMVAGVTMVFATSAVKKKEYVQTEREANEQTQVEWEINELTQEERDLLEDLQFDGYEGMTVSEFQDKANTLIDASWTNREMFERLVQDEALYRVRDLDDTSFFLFYVLSPLVSERWQEREFDGYVSVGQPNLPENVTADMATLEYGIRVKILDADILTVGEYEDVRIAAADMISNMLLDYSAEALADQERMQREIEEYMRVLEEKLSTEAVRVDIDWYYQPLDSLHTDVDPANTEGTSAGAGYHQSPEEWERSLQAEEQALYAEIQEEIQTEWESVLKPYLAFGLTYEYDLEAEDIKMYFAGKEVRGIIDEYRGTFISAHTGISTYAQDAIEVYAVYDGQGKLTELRAATKEEQEEWNLRRRQSTEQLQDISEEVREYLPGTNEDYDMLLSLKTTKYDKMSLADFDSMLLDWANEHFDSYSRIECDGIWNDFRVDLSQEDKEFVKCTIRLSGLENAMLVRSLHQGKTEAEADDVSIEGTLTKNPGEGAPQYTWCQMVYSFSYHVNDKEKVTVGERDRAVGGMSDGIENFWEQTDIDELLKMNKSDIIKKLNELAAKYSTRNITITVAEDRIGFECMDERSLMQEE